MDSSDRSVALCANYQVHMDSEELYFGVHLR